MSGGVQRPTRRYAYETDGSAIYSESFRRIRQGADLAAFTPEEAQVAVRMIHTAGDLDLPRHIVFHPGLVSAARGALRGGWVNVLITDVYTARDLLDRLDRA